jgi:F-type H+-transporting ATPase subunit b
VRRRAATAALTLAILVGLGLVPVQARAADAAAGIADLLWPAFNLVLLLAVLIYFARKPIRSFFAGRRAQIQNELQGSADQLEEAEATYTKWQRRLIGLESEIEAIRTTSRQRAEAERERILSEAQASADRIRRDAISAIEQELRRARDELREEAAQLALELAAERLEREVTGEDRDRLLDEFIDRVAAPESPAARDES